MEPGSGYPAVLSPIAMSSPAGSQLPKSPLFVDLDGTLLIGDTLWELLIRTVHNRPWQFLLIPLWLLRGKAFLKDALAQRVDLPVASLPFRSDLVSYLRAEATTRPVILATGAPRRVAQAVADHFGFFTAVLASDPLTNLTGNAKLAAIRQAAAGGPFSYAGNSMVDVSLWRHADEIVVAAAPRALARFEALLNRAATRVFPSNGFSIRDGLRLMRPHQWTKNALVLAPLFLAHQWGNYPALLKALAATVAFSLAASTIYIFNDLLDVDTDRAHPVKRTRPLAAGTVSIPAGIALMLFLGILCTLTALTLARPASSLLLLYVIASLAYSVHLKSLLLVDVLILALLYTLRLVVGGKAAGIPLSKWTLLLSIFMFFSLACMKRLGELQTTRASSGIENRRRGYQGTDIPSLMSLSSASSIAAVLVLALYVQSPEVATLYKTPSILLGLCPLFTYWLGRIQVLSNRGTVHSDPLVFALRDRASHAVGLATVLLVMAAAYF